METVAERERCGALLLAAVEPALSRGAMVQCMALLCNARKSKNAVRLGGVSELLAQFSGAVRGLSTERHCAMAMQPRENPVTLGGVNEPLASRFVVERRREDGQGSFSGCRLLYSSLVHFKFCAG